MSDYSNESLERIGKLEKLRKAGIDPYTAKYEKTHSIQNLIDEKGDLKTAEILMEKGAEEKFMIAGRVLSFRSHGKLSFAKIQDSTGTVQLCFIKGMIKLDTGKDLIEEIDIDKDKVSAYKFIEKYIDVGDFVGVGGELFITKHGELTLFVNKIQLLTKSLLPLPEKFHGLQDVETRLRKRYLDILLNKDVKDMVGRRYKFFKGMRDFFDERGFIEVETPILEITTGGADANPFVTNHQALDIDVFLRISAGELWQKRLMVASLEKTFEIGRVFRNEGMSPEHAQDYMHMEVYWAYADYKQMMQMMKDLYLHIVDTVYQKRKFTIRGYEIDFDNDWEEIDYTTVIKEKTGIDIFADGEDAMIAKLQELGISFEVGNKPRLVDTLWKYCRKQIGGPAFLINEPKFVSPLAKSFPDKPELTQRFHILIAGSEVGNGYSELNDPIDQKERFEEQQNLRDAGDDEAQMADFEFVDALMQGMPPTAGFGVSERLFAFLEDKPIREIQIFPLMKPLFSQQNVKPKPTKNETNTYKDLQLPSIEDAMKLVDKYSNNTKTHLIAVGEAMKYFANKLGQNEQAWQLVGLLHDIDWDFLEKDGEKHCKEDLEKICSEINLPTQLVEDIKSHAHFITGVQPDTLIRKYICAVDELTGFIGAVSKMMPNKTIQEVKVKSVKKKLKDKKFAAGVDRNETKNCETMLNIPLEEFIEDLLKGLSNS